MAKNKPKKVSARLTETKGRNEVRHVSENERFIGQKHIKEFS